MGRPGGIAGRAGLPAGRDCRPMPLLTYPPAAQGLPVAPPPASRTCKDLPGASRSGAGRWADQSPETAPIGGQDLRCCPSPVDLDICEGGGTKGGASGRRAARLKAAERAVIEGSPRATCCLETRCPPRGRTSAGAAWSPHAGNPGSPPGAQLRVRSRRGWWNDRDRRATPRSAAAMHRSPRESGT